MPAMVGRKRDEVQRNLFVLQSNILHTIGAQSFAKWNVEKRRLLMRQ